MPIKSHLCYYCSLGRFSKCLKTENMHSQATQAEKRSIYITKKKQQNKTKNKTMNATMTPLHSPGKILVEYNSFV